MEKVKIFLGSVENPADEKCNAFLEENKGISIVESNFIPYRDKNNVFDHVIFMRYNDGKKKIDPSNDAVTIRPITDYKNNPLLILEDLNKIEDRKSKDSTYLIETFKNQCPYSRSITYSRADCYLVNEDGEKPCTFSKCMYYKRALDYFKMNKERDLLNKK